MIHLSPSGHITATVVYFRMTNILPYSKNDRRKNEKKATALLQRYPKDM